MRSAPRLIRRSAQPRPIDGLELERAYLVVLSRVLLPGIDGLTARDIPAGWGAEAFLSELQEKLCSRTFEPRQSMSG
jgi:hypothetical protein